ncbi:hypothetical protein C8F04DRAFT_1098686 [Mycena alexandri]|uniref:Uncharacterized protein n=1 Tax=Mycena alexandri TaxID=1745969 RepID=A0AAD6SWS5_9AGAR|nr:hypothetical protein C8F04DRAFT_1098686 [Mycena alexandri]
MDAHIFCDDILIVTHADNPATKHKALRYFVTQVSKTIDDDWGRLCRKKIAHVEAARVAEVYVLPLFKDVLRRFEAEFGPKARRTPYQISLPNITPKESNPSLPPTPEFPSKPIPHFENVDLPPVTPHVRQGPKIKTRGASTELPLPVEVAIEAIPVAPVTHVPKTVYNLLRSIFLPRERSRFSSLDLKKIMTCKEIGFSCESGDGSRMKFVPPPGSASKSYVFHNPHGRGGKELGTYKLNYLQNDLNELYGWTIDSFLPKSRD